MTNLTKSTGINLKKGSKISLEKEGMRLEEVCIGLNWGAIRKKAFFGLLTDTERVDLDGSVAIFDGQKKLMDIVYYGKLRSKDGAIIHSGDDLSGDVAGDDGLDNEIIQIHLAKVATSAQTIVFFLNSYKKQDFATIPYSKIRIFEGNRRQMKSVFATFNLSAEDSFAGHVAMVMGKLSRKTANNWEFAAIGEATTTQDVDSTIELIAERYL